MRKPLQDVVKYSIILGLMFVPILLQGNQSLTSDDGVVAKKYDWQWTDASLSSVFDHIAMAGGIDIILDPNVKGKMSAKLRKKSWKEAFKIVCQIKNLHFEKKNDYIFVINLSDHIANQVKSANQQKQLESVIELEQTIIQLKNTNSADMVAPVKGLLSKRGKVTAVTHTNSLIINELPENMDKVAKYVTELDKEVLQISISAKLVEVSSGTQNDLGIQWSFFNKAAGWDVTHMPTNPVANTLERVSYGLLDPKGFSMALSFLFTEKHSEIVAEPQITTLEHKEATIYMGSQIPISHIDFAGNVTITTIDARSELTVTPSVTGNGQVRMELKPVKKSYEMTEDGPIVHEQGSETNVVVRDGETIVIAGMTTDEKQETEGGIPLLKDIPILGYLFKSHSKKYNKRDLIIFVTPHIIKSSGLEVLKDEIGGENGTPVEAPAEDIPVETN